MSDTPISVGGPHDEESPPSAGANKGCLTSFSYAVGGASFIPLLGLFFALVAIVLGIYRRTWALVAMGCGGIAFTVVLYGSLAYFGLEQRGGLYDRLRLQLTVNILDDTVRRIEFYKIQQGHYPINLGELYPENPKAAHGIVDPTVIERPGYKNPYIFYQLDPSGRFYFLRSVGRDGIPFTADDLLPSLTEEQRKNTGLRLAR